LDWRNTAAWCLHAEQVFDGCALRADVAVTVVDGRVAALGPVGAAVNQGLPVWRVPGTVVLGFFDIGAHIDLASCVQRLITQVGIDPVQALRMATSNPAQLMGVEASVGYLRTGMPARMALLDAHWRLVASV
jgi:imidazolonepropionase-like amidohydrolase